MTKLEEQSGFVTAKLQAEDKGWQEAPDYQLFDRKYMLGKMEQIHSAIIAEGYDDISEVDEALEHTQQFLNRSFDLYDGVVKPQGEIGRVFAVPVRTQRGDERYETEVFPYFPLMKSKFGVNANIRQRGLVGLPPTVLDVYSASPNSDLQGVVLSTPLYTDMQQDIMPDGTPEQADILLRVMSENINETARFTKQVLGAKVMGLGAVLPALTNFGASIKEKGLVTTTGHAGTVHLIVETARKVIGERGIHVNSKLGVIGGAGSIGYSSIDASLEMLPEFQIITFDKNEERLNKLIEEHESGSRIDIKDNALEVMKAADVIITAVTGRINLDKEDPNFELDLTGKYIIDDSQPGCFEKDQVEARGGKLLWVVGKDESDEKFLTRDNGYNFGDEAGIYGPHSIWGCEAEAGVIAASKEYNKALRERVAPHHVRSLKNLCDMYGITIADFQAYGQPVNIH